MSEETVLTRVEWQANRKVSGGGIALFIVTGDNQNGQWRFHERCVWEDNWHEIAATPELIAKAQRILVCRDTQ